jgi:hypothetical protein
MKHVYSILWSDILRKAPRWRGRVDGPKEDWASRGLGEAIEESAWRDLADWVGQESRRTTPPALSDLLEADLPLTPTTKQIIEVRQDLARLEAEALNDQARVAFDKLVGFLDMAIQHAKACEGERRRRSSTNFKWHGKD